MESALTVVQNIWLLHDKHPFLDIWATRTNSALTLQSTGSMCLTRVYMCFVYVKCFFLLCLVCACVCVDWIVLPVYVNHTKNGDCTSDDTVCFESRLCDYILVMLHQSLCTHCKYFGFERILLLFCTVFCPGACAACVCVKNNRELFNSIEMDVKFLLLILLRRQHSF